ncbi:MAG: SIMPL domain-containing protein [Cyanobacteria bacterium P01_G01_bin.49]
MTPLIRPAIAQEQVSRTLTVTGEGKQRIPTTLTDIRLGVEVSGKTATEVQQEVAQRTSAVVDFLRSRQVERLETTGIRLRPNYQYENNQRSLVGYIGTNTVSFRIETDAIGNLLDEAVKVGATRIDGVSFTATEEAIATAQKEALREATSDAQQQAKAVLEVLQFQSQEIINIRINGANVPTPPLVRSAETFKNTADAQETTPVIGGEQTVNASVTLQIRY